MNDGTVIANQFAIERLASVGGMGAVYRALDKLSGETVAVKVVRPNPDDDQELDRWRREARVLAELRHPGIVRYIAHGATPAGEGYLVMEWLEGQTLAERLRKGPLPVADALALVARVADALAAAHAHGMVHRDIKPANLFLPDGDVNRAKLLDFGLVRHGDTPLGATLAGVMMGTPGYVAPEQVRGSRAVDARADVFALGCVLYECLTGRPAFAGDHVMAVLAKILLEDVPRPGELVPVPEPLDRLVAEMLAKDPGGRPTDGAAVAAALAAIDLEPGAGAVPAARGALTRDEQRVVSVVVAGPPARAAGANAVTLRMGPVETETMARARAAIEVFGVRLDWLADGSLVAVLDGRGGATDQAGRAARCALALRRELPDAPVVLGTGRSLLAGRLPVGEVIDAAVRVLAEERAQDERLIRVDDVTAGLLGAGFELGSDARGWFLRGARQTDAQRTLLGRPTPCVGRDRELAVLEGMWDACVGEPLAQVALVTAPTGMGKSRLRAELVRRLRERAGEPLGPRAERGVGCEVWIARGDPMSAGAAFGMAAQLIRRAASITGEPASTWQRQLRARVARGQPVDEARSRITVFLAEMVGVPFGDDDSPLLPAARRDPVVMGDQMLRAWLDFVAGECERGPLLLVLEDLHWGDLPTVKLIDAALRELRERPLMVLALARPDVHDLFPRLWGDRDLHEIRLGELSRKASERLVRAVLGETTPELTERLVATAAGHAFFLEELIRAASEGRTALPPTVLAMAQSRLDTVPGEPRRLLRAASVYGQLFSAGGAAALLADLDAAQVRELLVDLAARELVAPATEARHGGEQAYVFRHALVREAAYAMLTDHDRALGHRLAGEWLQAHGEPVAMTLAEHFERGGVPAQAARWLRRAAEEALRGNDFAAALARCDGAARALSALGHGEGDTLGALRVIQAEAHYWRGEHVAAERRALEAMAALPRGSELWLGAAGEAAAASGNLLEHDRLERLAADLAALPAAGVDPGRLVVALARTTCYLVWAAGAARAAPVAARLDELAPLVPGDPAVTAWVHAARAVMAFGRGDSGQALSWLELAIADFERAGDVRYACLNRINAGFALADIGVYPEAERAMRVALDAALHMGLSNVVALARNNIGLTLMHLGRLDEARQLEREAAAAFAEQGDRRLEGVAHVYLAMTELRAGDLGRAEREARLAAAILADAPPTLAYAEAVLAEIQLSAGRVLEAVDSAQSAMATLERLGGIDGGESLIRLVHARALDAAGQSASARTRLREANERITARAAKLAEPWRTSFLEKMHDNRRTRELLKEWLK